MPRRVTLANRSLRFYIATENPSEYLKTIAEFVLKVYAPMWFTIKSKPSCQDGTKHLWMPMNRSRYLPDRLKRYATSESDSAVSIFLRRKGTGSSASPFLLSNFFGQHTCERATLADPLAALGPGQRPMGIHLTRSGEPDHQMTL